MQVVQPISCAFTQEMKNGVGGGMAQAEECPCFLPMLLCAYTVMLCVTVSNKDGGWGGIVITLFDSVGNILLFC